MRWPSFFRKAPTSMLGLLLSGSWWRRAGPVRLRPSFTGLPTRPKSMFHCNSRSHSTTSIMLPTTGLTAVTTTRPWRNRHLQGISPKANPATTSPIFNPAFCSSATLPVNFTRNEKSFVRRRGHSSCGRVLIEAFLLLQQRPQLDIQFGHNFENSALNRQDRNNSRQCCEHQAVRR